MPRSNARYSAAVSPNARREQALDRRVAGLVHVQDGVLECAALAETREELLGLASRDADCDEDHRERLAVRCARALDDLRGELRGPASPGPTKIGSFCPRTSVFRPSIAEMPVSMKSAGRARRAGFIGAPSTGRIASPIGGGRPSIGAAGSVECARPSSSRPTTAVATSPVSTTSARRAVTVRPYRRALARR